MLIKKNYISKQDKIRQKIKVEIESEKNKIIKDNFIRFFFVLSFKLSNIFFSFFYKHFNKYHIIKKNSCGLVNRRSDKNKQIKRRKHYKTKLSFIFDVFYDFFNTIDYKKLKNKYYKSLIFLKFNIYFLDSKVVPLMKKTINLFKYKKLNFKYLINYKQSHNGCRQRSSHRRR